MNTRTTLIASALLAAGLLSGAAHAALQGRDLDGNLSTFAILANAWYEFAIGSKMRPYVGGGVGWGEVINGGFGMVLDGTSDSDRRLKAMLHWDVNNGIARRAWARNPNAVWSIEQEMKREPLLKVTLPNEADDALINGLVG